MGAQVPDTVAIYPKRVHGMVHWLEYTVDALPSQYHVILKFEDAEEVDIGLGKLTIGPGMLRNYCDEPQDKWADLVEKVQEGKEPDEIVQWLDAQCVSQMFADAWKTHIPMPPEEEPEEP